MTDFNLFTFNCRGWPRTAPLVIAGRRPRRQWFGNLSLDNPIPIHLHRHRFELTATEGGHVPPVGAFGPWPPTSTFPVGATRDIEWVADVPSS